MPDLVNPSKIERKPSDSEKYFFLKHPEVGGYADFDSSTIVMNPFSKLKETEKAAVRLNEYTRVVMKNRKLVPDFQMTPKQIDAFKNYGDENSQRETIVGRILSGDPSALDITDEQVEFVEKMKQLPEFSHGLRVDGSKKGFGWLGPIKNKDGYIMTELSTGVNIGGVETLIPLIVPTLTDMEIHSLRSGEAPSYRIMEKAVEHAKKRIKEGKSPFKE